MAINIFSNNPLTSQDIDDLLLTVTDDNRIVACSIEAFKRNRAKTACITVGVILDRRFENVLTLSPMSHLRMGRILAAVERHKNGIEEGLSEHKSELQKEAFEALQDIYKPMSMRLQYLEDFVLEARRIIEVGPVQVDAERTAQEKVEKRVDGPNSSV